MTTEQPCNVDVTLLSGCYAWRGEGTNTGGIPVAAVGFFHFGGRGAVTGSYEGSHGGTHVSRTFTGTVSTDANGYGVMDFTDNAGSREILQFVMAQGATELFMVHTRAGTVAHYVARKV